MERGSFAEIDHTADLGLELRGRTPAEVLEAAQRGLIHVLFGETPEVEPVETRVIELSAASWPELLKAWLEALYGLVEGEGFVAVDAQVEAWEPARLRAEVRGAVPGRSAIAHASELKAVTYHQLAFEQGDKEWRARAILDV